MGESYLNRIIKTGTSNAYIRPTGMPNGESILANAPIIENSGTNYYPIYYLCLMDTLATENFTKTGTGVSYGADAFVFSDEPSTLYVGNSTHTFNTANDYTTSENWKCRYVIAYASEMNIFSMGGITINLYGSKTAYEFIGSQHLKFSNSSAVFGNTSGVSLNMRYINLSNSSFYNNTISASSFCSGCMSLEYLSLPSSVTTINASNFCYICYALKTLSIPGVTTINCSNFCNYCANLETLSLPALTSVGSDSNYFCGNCYSLKNLSLPELTTIAGVNFCNNCQSLKTLSMPKLTTISNSYFCSDYCYSLKNLSLPALTSINAYYFCNSTYSLEYFEIPSTLTTITNNVYTLLYTQFIKLPTDFDIDACNFTGATGYSKSLEWFTHLASQLKDNSSGTAKTMTIGATNIALIPTATATIISNKNWTLS